MSAFYMVGKDFPRAFMHRIWPQIGANTGIVPGPRVPLKYFLVHGGTGCSSAFLGKTIIKSCDVAYFLLVCFLS